MVCCCWQEGPLVNVAHSLGVEIFLEANDASKTSARKTTPHIDFGGVLHGSNNLLVSWWIPDPALHLIEVDRCLV